MVVGTVRGIRDIGKDLVSMMMEGAGFEVVDIGINNPVSFLDPIEEHKPDILGMSALLTTTMPYMKVVIETLVEKGIRDDYIVLVGDAPLNEAFAEHWCRWLLPRRGGCGGNCQGVRGPPPQHDWCPSKRLTTTSSLVPGWPSRRRPDRSPWFFIGYGTARKPVPAIEAREGAAGFAAPENPC